MGPGAGVTIAAVRSRLRFILAIGLALVLGGWLAYTSLGGSLETYAGPSELAAGKTSNQPVVLVRGVEFNERGQSEPSVQRDVVMPTEMDLFK